MHFEILHWLHIILLFCYFLKLQYITSAFASPHDIHLFIYCLCTHYVFLNMEDVMGVLVWGPSTLVLTLDLG